MNDKNKEKINQDWKEQVNKEKDSSPEGGYHQPTFSIFLSSLSMQAMIALGKLENPITKKTDTNYDQARFLIDTLDVIKEKTKNNLTKDEENLLNESLYSLRMMYVDAKK